MRPALRTLVCALLCCAANIALADDEWTIEKGASALPEELAAPVAERLAGESIKVKSSPTRTVCELWLCKQWPLQSGFKASSSVIYPFALGELVGVVKFRRKATDFRGQEIPSGIYTMRYGQQPVDGNHVGTSDTRDFLLLEKVEQDQEPKDVAQDELFKRSAEAAGTSHPAIFSLLPPGSADAEASVHHDEQHDWWILHLTNPATGGKSDRLPMDLVVTGQSAG